MVVYYVDFKNKKLLGSWTIDKEEMARVAPEPLKRPYDPFAMIKKSLWSKAYHSCSNCGLLVELDNWDNHVMNCGYNTGA